MAWKSVYDNSLVSDTFYFEFDSNVTIRTVYRIIPLLVQKDLFKPYLSNQKIKH